MNEYKKKLVYSYEDLDLVVKELEYLMATCQVFALTGPLGAGKTTVIQKILRDCGVTTTISSPTFAYVNEHSNSQGQKFYHFDLYRIKTAQEFQSQGFDEYLYQPNSWAFVEWPEVIKPLLTRNVCFVSFDYHEELDKRLVEIECVY
jgi:tRNA threonylcarbamoyladenosine biosynthesis protein TsaE